jgi:hypothetical protein
MTTAKIYPILSDNTDHDRTSGAMVLCPACDWEYSHIREVFTRFGTDRYEGGHAYTGTIAKGVDPRWRRDGLVIVFDGECGHSWELLIQQHKGNNYVERHVVRSEDQDA